MEHNNAVGDDFSDIGIDDIKVMDMSCNESTCMISWNSINSQC